MIYDITDLLPLQYQLDADIAKIHHLTYESTSRRRLLALFVEISELANATRDFKFWSLKGPESKERLLDEFADGLHFFLGIFIEKKVSKRIFDVDPKNAEEKNLTDMFLDVNILLSKYGETGDESFLLRAFVVFLHIGARLGFGNDEMHAGYKSKLRVNYSRQENNY